MVFSGGPNYGSYSLFVAPLVTGAIAGRTGSGVVVGALPNVLLGVAIGVIVLRDMSRVTPGSLESVFGLFGLLGAALLGIVGGVVGAICGAFGGFVGGHLFRRSKPTEPPVALAVPVGNDVSSAAPNRCATCGQSVPSGGSAYCQNCGSPLRNLTVQSTIPPSPMSGPIGPFEGNQYVVDQKILTVRDTFGIKDVSGNLLAYVKKQLVSFGPKFWFEASNGERLGEIHGKILTVRPTFEVYDKQGNLLALIKKKLLKLLGSEWWMETTDGRRIARIKGNIVEHDYRIETPSGNKIAQIHKKWVAIRDSYGVDILDRSISPYLTLSYVIAMDNAEHKRSKSMLGTRFFR